MTTTAPARAATEPWCIVASEVEGEHAAATLVVLRAAAAGTRMGSDPDDPMAFDLEHLGVAHKVEVETEQSGRTLVTIQREGAGAFDRVRLPCMPDGGRDASPASALDYARRACGLMADIVEAALRLAAEPHPDGDPTDADPEERGDPMDAHRRILTERLRTIGAAAAAMSGNHEAAVVAVAPSPWSGFGLLDRNSQWLPIDPETQAFADAEFPVSAHVADKFMAMPDRFCLHAVAIEAAIEPMGVVDAMRLLKERADACAEPTR